MTQSNNEGSNGWNLSSLWEKIKANAIRFGRGTTRQVLLMYYVLKSKETPRGDQIDSLLGFGLSHSAHQPDFDETASYHWLV